MAAGESSLEILGYQLDNRGITLFAEKKQGLEEFQRLS